MAKLMMPELDTGGIPAFEGIAKAYVHLTGDHGISGFFRPDNCSEGLRSNMDFNSGTFAYIFQNSTNRHLSKEYKRFPYREEILISEKKSVKDFRTIHSQQLGYFGDTPDVDPETGDYDDMGTVDDTEAQYRIGQKGGVIWFSRRIIVNDDIDAVRGVTKRVARSARMTHAKYVWYFYINNAICPDGTAWFTEAHGNLGSDAIDIDPAATAITALANMEEPGSGEKVSLDLATFKWHLVLPISLWKSGPGVNQRQYYYTVNDLTNMVPNPCLKLFGENNERIVICPFQSDTNDWGVIRDKEDVTIVEMSYLNGREEPEFILHEGPKGDMTFRNDRIGYKVRHEYGGVLAGYQGGYKSVVT